VVTWESSGCWVGSGEARRRKPRERRRAEGMRKARRERVRRGLDVLAIGVAVSWSVRKW
jgi:hypothetical protein